MRGAVLVCVGALVAAARADQPEFDALWADAESHLTADVGTIAQTVWGYLCSECQYTQPSAHHNQSVRVRRGLGYTA